MMGYVAQTDIRHNGAYTAAGTTVSGDEFGDDLDELVATGALKREEDVQEPRETQDFKGVVDPEDDSTPDGNPGVSVALQGLKVTDENVVVEAAPDVDAEDGVPVDTDEDGNPTFDDEV
jgi:hypothetical protein